MPNITELARSKDIKNVLISFTDLLGVMRSKMVPISALAAMQKNGAGFAGFATYLDMTPADPDVLAMPDLTSLIQLPWKKDVAWVSSDLVMNKQPVEQSPRHVLKKVLTQAAKSGYVFKTGVECEFFLLNAQGTAPADTLDRQKKPCYDQQSLLRCYDLISELSDHMQVMGWEPYQSDHEDGNGQFEMNWGYADALTTANRHAFFKFMTRSLAEKYGLRATFMPKPIASLTGTGCHMHFSLWDKTGKKNLFCNAKGEMGLSSLAYHFLGGVLKEASAICAITNPTVNSYKRINAAITASGATWSPNTISYTGNNRTHMVRIPDSDRFELRLPDGAANPYLLPAAVLAAGLDGIAKKQSPGKRLDNNMYTQPDPKVGKLPQTLHEALGFLEKSAVLKSSLGEKFISSYANTQHSEWKEYLGQVSAWESERYMDI